MKRIILFLLILHLQIWSFSQNTLETTDTVLISSEQLKIANLIFIEHEKLLNENQLLYTQLDNYDKKYNYLIEIDSLKEVKYNKTLDNYEVQIKNLEKQVTKKSKSVKCWRFGCILVSLGLIFCLIK